MTAQQFVQQLWGIDGRIKFMTENLEQLNSELTRLCGSGYEERYDPSSKTDAPFVSVIEKKMEVEERLKRLIEKRQTVLNAIYSLDDTDECNVLLYRYRENMSFREIARVMYCHHTTAIRKHDSALEHLRF